MTENPYAKGEHGYPIQPEFNCWQEGYEAALKDVGEWLEKRMEEYGFCLLESSIAKSEIKSLKSGKLPDKE